MTKRKPAAKYLQARKPKLVAQRKAGPAFTVTWFYSDDGPMCFPRLGEPAKPIRAEVEVDLGYGVFHFEVDPAKMKYIVRASGGRTTR